MKEDRIKTNIFFSMMEKGGIVVAQFFSSILLAKYLPREEFGAIAVVSGIFAFLQFFNIAVENILVRDFYLYKESKDETQDVLSRFISINLLKSIFIGVIGLASGGLYYFQHSGDGTFFLYVTLSLTLVLVMDSLISPLILYSSLVFKQALVTKISLVRWSLNVGGLLFLMTFPSIKVVLLKDMLIFLVVILLWIHYTKKELGLVLKLSGFKWEFLKEKVLGYSLWVHLIGVISAVIYKADASILYYFSSLTVVGKYNIALSLANVASVIPSVLIAQNNVALSHCATMEEARATTFKFLRFSIYIGVLSFIAFVLLGKVYLRIVTKTEIDEIYFYLLFIVSGVLLAKILISPLVAFIQLKGDVKKLLINVQVPLFIFVLISYTLSSYLYGAGGLAASNLINGLVWLMLISLEIRNYGFKISQIGSFKDDYYQVKSYVGKYLAKA